MIVPSLKILPSSIAFRNFWNPQGQGEPNRFTSRSYLFIIALSASISCLLPSSAWAETDSVILRDYFYPFTRSATWTYLEKGEGGPSKAVQVRVSNPKIQLTSYEVKEGLPAGKIRKAAQLTTSVGKYTGQDLSSVQYSFESNSYYGLQPNYSYLGFDDIDRGIRFDTEIKFPEKLKISTPIQIISETHDGNGNRSSKFKIIAEFLDRDTLFDLRPHYREMIHLRFIFINAGVRDKTEEQWWVRGLGVVKTQSVASDGKTTIRRLHSYSIPDSKLDIRVTDLFPSGILKTFPPTVVGGTGRRKTFSITNTGVTTLVNLRASIKGSSSFAIAPFTCKNLAPGATVKIVVTFAPKNLISNEGWIEIDSIYSHTKPFLFPISGLAIEKAH
ncbi:MAG: hypothetical protein ABIT37_14895 [Luteolibacter sp.]